MRLSNRAQVDQAFKKELESLTLQLAEHGFEIIQKAIREARDNANFMNWTNNLRSSLGAVMALNGSILKQDFQLSGSGKKGDGTKGLQEAQKLAAELASKYPNTIHYILVAGEYYAGYVEAKGFDVLTMSAWGAERELKNLMKIIKR